MMIVALLHMDMLVRRHTLARRFRGSYRENRQRLPPAPAFHFESAEERN